MNLVKWNPWREMTSLEDRMNRFFDESFFPMTRLSDGMSMGNWRPVVDVYDKGDAVVIKAELPGVDKKDIHVEMKDHVLTLRGERSYEKEVKEESYYRKERAFGQFNRSFNLPADVDPEKIKADFKDGILEVSIPKTEENKPRQITVL